MTILTLNREIVKENSESHRISFIILKNLKGGRFKYL